MLIGDYEAETNTFTRYFSTNPRYGSSCNPRAANVVVRSVVEKVVDHLDRQGLGTPLNESPTPMQIMKDLLAHQAGFIQGDIIAAFDTVTQTIFTMISKLRQEDRERQSKVQGFGREAGAMSPRPVTPYDPETSGGGLKAAIAALHAQVVARDEEIDNCLKDIALRDEALEKCREEIKRLKMQVEADVARLSTMATAAPVERPRRSNNGDAPPRRVRATSQAKESTDVPSRK